MITFFCHGSGGGKPNSVKIKKPPVLNRSEKTIPHRLLPFQVPDRNKSSAGEGVSHNEIFYSLVSELVSHFYPGVFCDALGNFNFPAVMKQRVVTVVERYP